LDCDTTCPYATIPASLRQTGRLSHWAVSLLRCFAAVALIPCNSQGQDVVPIDLGGFHDVVKHWNDKYGRDRNDNTFSASQYVQIADGIIAFQNPDGGWPKSFNPLLNVPESELRTLLGGSLNRSTFDNRSTYTHVEFLAKVFARTGDPRFRKSTERGIDFIFDEQRTTGGWRGADVDAVTFNDDVMVGVMRLLKRIRGSESHFDWLDDDRRSRALVALDRAIDVTLKCQIVVDGSKSAWCQQHSHETFEPVKARSYELPAICPVESSEVVRFLMELKNPSPEVVDAIECAVTWIHRVQIRGIRIDEIKIAPVRFEGHTTSRDRVVVADPSAPPIWTRYYEVGTDRPFFCNRDGTVVYSLAEVHHERRTGYGWYSSAPRKLIQRDYPKWKSERESKQDESSFSDQDLTRVRDGFNSRRDIYLAGYVDDPLYEIDAAIDACRDHLRRAHWIWYPESTASANLAIGRHRFRRTLLIHDADTVQHAYIAIAADNTGTISVNGNQAGHVAGFHHATAIDLSRHLVSGENTITIDAENLGDSPNPAGVIAALHVEFHSGDPTVVVTDAAWHVSADTSNRTPGAPVDDSEWKAANVVGPWGCAPWGNVAVSLDVRVNQYVFSRLSFALSALHLGMESERASTAVVEAARAVRTEHQSSGEFGLHWMGASFARVYFLFGPNGTREHRLTAEASDAILHLFADWARSHSRIAESDPESTWRIWGSENHSAQRDTTRWAAARIIADSKVGKHFRYADDSTVTEQLDAWRSFLKRYFRERVKRGMLVEISPSGYGSRTLQGWHNIFDFTDDAELKRLAKAALDLWWAEWAQEQLGGMRGGGKTRLYPGAWALSKSDRNRAMSWFYLGRGKPAHQHETLPIIATTTYRMPLVVMDIALDAAARGTYECRSRRLGRQSSHELPESLAQSPDPIYEVDPNDGGLIRYSYCTPDFIIGTLMHENRPKTYWTAISQQNRWHGVIFAGDQDSTLYPRCDTDRSTYNAHWSLQNKGTLITQKSRHADQAKAMRVCFSTDLERHTEGEWIFARAMSAFAAVKIVEGSWSWDDKRWLRCESEYTPVIIEVARSVDFGGNFQAFVQAVLDQSIDYRDGVLKYRGLNDSGDFTFDARGDSLPKWNDFPIDLSPDRAFESPFVNETWASGVVRIEKGKRKMTVDVNEPSDSN
jgi:PelA/Pel-15E family pectate lyase